MKRDDKSFEKGVYDQSARLAFYCGASPAMLKDNADEFIAQHKEKPASNGDKNAARKR
jgi:hypothetical protein